MEPSIAPFKSVTQLLFLVSLLSLAANVSGISLRIVPASKATQQTKIAANYPFDPKLAVEIIDASSNRITTGADSVLDVTPVLSNASVCLSVDSSFQLKDGYGIFPGSICEPTTGIYISFTVSSASSGSLISDDSNVFNVVGEIHVAVFQKDMKQFIGTNRNYILDRVEDVNKGTFLHYNYRLFPDRTMSVQSYYCPSMVPVAAFKVYNEMRKYHKENPEKKAYALIGFGDNDISRALLPFTVIDDYSVLSYHDDTLTEFSDKVKYPTFNRIAFSNDVIVTALMLYLKSRMWSKIIVINQVSSKFPDEFYTIAAKHGVEIVKEFMWDEEPNYNTDVGKYANMFDSIRLAGVNIILNTVKSISTSALLYSEAVRENMTQHDGYQWIGYNNILSFPLENFPLLCHTAMDKLCNVRFHKSEYIRPLFFVKALIHRNWYWTLIKRQLADEEKEYKLLSEFEFTEIMVWAGLANDAIAANVLAIHRLITAKKTVTGIALAVEIRTNTDFDGWTGKSNIKLNPATGNRDGGFHFEVSQMYANQTLYDTRKAHSIAEFAGSYVHWDWSEFVHLMKMTNRIFAVSSVDTTDSDYVERITNGNAFHRWSRGQIDDLAVISTYSLKYNHSERNNRTFKAYKGVYVFEEERQGSNEHWMWSGRPDTYLEDEVEIRYEMVPPTHYCKLGCGGKKLDPADVNIYENGICISNDKCKCRMANGLALWIGKSCDVPVCSSCSQFGICASPGNCVCHPGYSGVDCAVPICDSCSSGGVCSTPGNCICNPGQYGPACETKCTCVNGECNAGKTGDGKCVSCSAGYIGVNCDTSLVTICLPTIIGCGLLAVGLFFLTQLFIKRAKVKAALFNNDWIVNWDDFKRHDEVTGRSSMFLSALSMNNNAAERKQLNTGVWEGIDVHYQKLDKGSIQLTDSLRLEVKKIREMRHINVAQFIGCCLDAPNVAILTELQPKGSLDDILTNEDIKLPWNFRFALMKGVCTGLDYLHKSEIKSHGRLKSSNILIDNRWTVKLSGFGLLELKSGQKNVGEYNIDAPNKNVDLSKANYGSLLWTAPELLRTGAYHIDHIGRGTVEGDAYSFGMVMSEMCTRDLPFADVMLEKEELVCLLLGKREESAMKVWNDYLAKLNVEQGGWVRPCIKDKEWPSKYEKRKALKKVIESAWHEDPVHRPTIIQLRNLLEQLDPQRGELMDHLVNMLEKYSSNLEDIVTKRTKQLQKEKQKTEDLVSRLLPKSVAEDLKQGKRVEPISYDYVTIYFSDIVGFTQIAKASTPLEVVALLNDMYTSFDSIAANYDVYKVETIGDAYMIVSGLPTKNGDKHAGEICTTAMDLMCAIGSFQIAHLKDVKLSLRAGVHTGNVVAGVVGLKMPRYCLFGESVNVASQMESGGKPLRIHISEDTYDILCRLGGYHCEFRQEIDVKGRGLIKTYWLTGKDGYTKKLPEPVGED